jgi:hypothetical protein
METVPKTPIEQTNAQVANAACGRMETTMSSMIDGGWGCVLSREEEFGMLLRKGVVWQVVVVRKDNVCLLCKKKDCQVAQQDFKLRKIASEEISDFFFPL